MTPSHIWPITVWMLDCWFWKVTKMYICSPVVTSERFQTLFVDPMGGLFEAFWHLWTNFPINWWLKPPSSYKIPPIAVSFPKTQTYHPQYNNPTYPPSRTLNNKFTDNPPSPSRSTTVLPPATQQSQLPSPVSSPPVSLSSGRKDAERRVQQVRRTRWNRRGSLTDVFSGVGQV